MLDTILYKTTIDENEEFKILDLLLDLLKSPWSIMQYVGLLDVKAWVHIPGETSKMIYEKYFFGNFFSTDFWQKL